ncbi:MAG TPA: prolyl oligopeptidase family serine peptidase [Actinomycetes bacterium]|nr:prolyl oligopeptidase family serine peptidase [Actinomycetes bacterium]
MDQAKQLPYGSWPSPISAADVARGGVDLEFPEIVATATGHEVWWVEGRPTDGGRSALVRRAADGSISDVLGPKWSLRSRIIEYGAKPWTHLQTATGGAAVFCFWDDQRLYLLPDGSPAPTPLTAAPTDDVTHMYGEPVAGPSQTVVAVRETHRDGVVSRALVQIPLDGSAAEADDAVIVLNDQHHFYAFPRLSPDQRNLAYIGWDHPNMPWDHTSLAVVDLSGPSPMTERVLIGDGAESVLQPEWADPEHLYAVSDRSGWWNLYRLSLAGDVQPLVPRDEEFAGPMWLLGFTSYAVLGDGRLAVTHGLGDAKLSVLDPTTGTLTDSGLDISVEPNVVANGSLMTSVAGSDSLPLSVVAVDLAAAHPTLDVVRGSYSETPDPAYLPRVQARTYTGSDGQDIHAFVYPPRHPSVSGPDGELPPFMVFVHGGPTSHVTPELSLHKAYFTSRGIGVIDVNYGGSTGYGRAYRERLVGQWGVVDVADTVSAALGVASGGEADRSRLLIRGGSAGGWTTLACLVQSDVFAAGAAYFPVADLLPFVEDTHDFESRYLDSLIGPLPAARELYVERSPLSHLDRLTTPLLLLQGEDDKVVPPSQPASVNDALAGTGIPHAYLLFPGEQHGFRQAESNIRALEAELSFYGQVLGFDPPGVPVVPLEH